MERFDGYLLLTAATGTNLVESSHPTSDSSSKELIFALN